MSDGDKPVPPEKDPDALSPLKLLGATLAGAAIGALVVKTAAALKVPVKSEIGELASYLEGHLGLDVTAYLAGVEDDPRIVYRWISGEVETEPLLADRLRFAYDVVRPIIEAYDGETANAWLFGMKDWLNGDAPVAVLRDRPESWGSMVEEAQAFAEL